MRAHEVPIGTKELRAVNAAADEIYGMTDLSVADARAILLELFKVAWRMGYQDAAPDSPACLETSHDDYGRSGCRECIDWHATGHDRLEVL